MPTGYSGQGFSLRGEKARYVLPPSFRNTIAPTDADARTLCLAKHDRWDCLTGFAKSRVATFEAQATREEQAANAKGRDFDWDQRMAQLWGFKEVSFDASGRFILPDSLGRLCGMDGGICFIGGSPFFTLWSPDKLYAMDGSWAGQQALCREDEAEALAKAKRK
ncbi:division/cell wall cluster transcriptional repressor MraZ [Altererythrobacter xixiisoli]|uniref:Division/cell wall cluster transcriptional repressor MraZ n=1 Tax=Croceibacterium xixiisoli TaxID=1476466 RepID=A0A6I4TUC6_9SPHN|nr:division/cell wall cluster transcriptional repressor MraZ [Croceibacterium xixiisoli]MXO98188.1 division/cell wall cluster transcriptional repressor MraZ [Croceibacterium xixiisoli]